VNHKRRALVMLAGSLAVGLVIAPAATPAPATAPTAPWQSLFDGASIAVWKASDEPGTFSVANGEIVIHGPRSHLFYAGPVAKHDFRNFEFKAEVLTKPHANSGVYFHTQFQEHGWPAKGYEVQINNSHSDPSRTAGLYGIQDYMQVPANDNEWFALYIRVEGKHIVTKVNGKVIADYVEPENAPRTAEFKDRLVSHGTFALQGHDPGSETRFRNIFVRLLP
jgi:3-keto-disaccharide hydrolase